MSKVKAELEGMECEGVISSVLEPTEWCAPMVLVIKKSEDVRICVDLKHLNESIVRPKFVNPMKEDILSKLSDSTVFSNLDAASGFWQIPLDSECVKLTTFITPFGRYCFNRLPFGITSAPEIFQFKMSELLKGLEGVVAWTKVKRQQVPQPSECVKVPQTVHQQRRCRYLKRQICCYSKPSMAYKLYRFEESSWHD